MSGDGKALDPKDPEHRQAVEEAFAAILSESADLEPEAFAAQAAQFAGATGIVPERLVTRVSAGLRRRAVPGVRSAGFSPNLENQQLSGSCCVSYRTASL